MNKIAEFLVKHMDSLHDLFEWIDSYLEMGILYLNQAKHWMEKILHYIEQALNTLAQATAKKGGDYRAAAEEHLFV